MGFVQQREKLKTICLNLLSDGKVDLILGFAPDETGEKAVPFFIRSTEELEKIRWDEACTPNLAKYLLELKGRIAIIAKPCDSRAIVMYMAEGMVARDNVYIIGMECAGMRQADSKPVPGCDACDVRNPPLYDLLVESGEEIDIPAGVDGSGTEAAASYDERLLAFTKEIDRCMLCYSCRQACYGCNCAVCFMERGIPDWLPSEPDSGKKMMFHLGRAMHLAGRCIECGACERACPSGVRLRYLIKELTDFCREIYGYRAGMNLQEAPAMTTFDRDDTEIGLHFDMSYESGGKGARAAGTDACGGEDSGSGCCPKRRD